MDTARDHGWLDAEWTETVDALADLVIGLHAGGGVNESFGPSWRCDGEFKQEIRTALKTVDVGVQEHASGMLAPADHGAALGRIVVAGAPQSIGQNRDRLPDWVFLADADRRETWLRTLIWERGSQFKDRSPTRNLDHDRPQAFFVDVAVLIEAVTGVEAHLHDGRVMVPADAVRELGLA